MMKRLFNRLGIFVEKKHLLIIFISLALIVPSVFGAMLLEMKTGNETFVSTNSQVYKDFDKFTHNFSSDTVIILLTGENLTQLLQPGTVASMDTLENDLNENEQIILALGPAFMIKQAIDRQNGTAELPDTLEDIQDIVLENGQIRTDFEQVFPDTEHAFIAATLDGGLSRDEQEDVIVEIGDAINDAGFEEGIEPVVTGVPVLLKEMTEAQSSSMTRMLSLSIVIMLVVLVLIFSVRGFFAWRWLPLGAVLIAIVYAFGAMGVLSIPITMVTMAAFPILIGLGVDYAIQFHNRYDEEARRGETVADAIIDAVIHIGPTIGIAVVAACLGFAALFFSPVPMIQDFGLTLIIGVSACYLLSLFFLLAILYWHDRRNGVKAKSSKNNKKPKKEEGTHIVDKALHHLAPWVIRNPAIILPIALVLCVGGIIADGYIDTETNTNNFVSGDMQSVKNLHLAEDVLGGVHTINIFIEAEDVTNPLLLDWIDRVEQDIRNGDSKDIAGINSIANLVKHYNDGILPGTSQEIEDILEEIPSQIKRNFITDNHQAANISITLPELSAEQSENLKEDLTGYIADHPDGLKATVTGNEVFKIELLDALTSGRMEMTLIGILMVFVGLFLLFKFKLIPAVIAILPIGLILGWSSGMMYVMGIKYTPVTATLGALIIGIGVEFTILLMMRYYEERDKGEGVMEAMTTAMARIGRAVIASGFTVIGGFAALLIAKDFPILQDFGVVTLINVFFALVSTLLVLPTLIVLIDRWRELYKGRKNSESAL